MNKQEVGRDERKGEMVNINVTPYGFGCRNFVDKSGYAQPVSAIIVLREVRTDTGVMRFYYSCNNGNFCFSDHCRYARGTKLEESTSQT